MRVGISYFLLLYTICTSALLAEDSVKGRFRKEKDLAKFQDWEHGGSCFLLDTDLGASKKTTNTITLSSGVKLTFSSVEPTPESFTKQHALVDQDKVRRSFELELSKYPRGILLEVLSDIIIVPDLVVHGVQFVGKCDPVTHAIYLCSHADVGKDVTEQLTSVLHHELAHLLIRRYPFPREEWLATLPATSKRYPTNHLTQIVQARQTFWETEAFLNGDGVLNVYSTFSIDEDIDSFSAMLFVKSDHFERQLRWYSQLSEKYRICRRFYRQLEIQIPSDRSPSVDEERALKAALATAVECLFSDDEESRAGACSQLVDFGPAASIAVPKLIDLLRTDKSSTVRRRACHALGGPLSPFAKIALPELCLALQGDNDLLSMTAAGVLADIGPGAESALDTLMIATKHKSPLVRIRAIGALAMIAPTRTSVVECILDRLSDSNADVKLCAIEVLGQIGSKTVNWTQRLLELQADSDARVRSAARNAIGERQTAAEK